jgi:hypothetical protein
VIQTPAPDAAVIVLDLNVAEQRRVVEHMAGGACFRMLVKKSVWDTAKASGACPSWQFGTLKDGRHIMWQTYASLNKLRRGPMQNPPLYLEIKNSIIGDEIE